MRENKASPKTQYLKKLFDIENKYFSFAKESANKIRPEMSISFLEGKILEVLLKMIKAKKVIEVGAFTGYSALWISRALGENGKLWTLEYEAEHARLAKEALNDFPNCEVIAGNALESLNVLKNKGPFDAIFIDADKGGYMDYLQWAEKHIRKGGLIIGDNTYLFENVYLEQPNAEVGRKAWEVMREFNKTLSDTEKYTSIILPTTEGMTVSIKEF